MSVIADYLRTLFGGHKDAGRILMLGLDASGRTTLLYKLKLGEVVTTIPTIGFNVEEIDYPHKRLGTIRITAWDVGGCDKIRPLWRHYFQNTQAVLFFVDANDRDRLAEAGEELGRLMAEDELRGAPLLVLANKQDLPNALPAEEAWARMHVPERCLIGRKWTCLPTAGLHGTGVPAAMEWLGDAMAEYRRSQPPAPTTTSMATASGGQAGDKSGGTEPGAPDVEALLTRWLQVEDEPDDEFLAKLADYTLDTWDHRAHLRIAWLYLTRLGRREGMAAIFKSLEAFIANSPRTARGGDGSRTTFHHTLTYTWAHLVHYAIVATPNITGTFKTFLVMNPQLCNGGLFLHYYTKPRIMSPEARAAVVLPDKRPLPSLVTDTGALPKKSAEEIIAALPKTGALTDAQFLASVITRRVAGWCHEAELRAIWACLRARGGAAGAALACDVLRAFQGTAYHATITAFWVTKLRGLLEHDWPHQAAALDAEAAGAGAGAQGGPGLTSVTQELQAASLTADSVSSVVASAPAAGADKAGQQPEAAGGEEQVQQLLSRAQPAEAAAAAGVPEWAQLTTAKGYTGDRVRKWVMDQRMYEKHYTKALVYGAGAAQQVVQPDRKALTLLV